MKIHFFLLLMLWGTLGFLGIVGAQDVADKEQLEFFESRIRPLLIEHCFECHSRRSNKTSAGLLLDSREAILAGGESGPAVLPEDVESSLLVEAVRYESFEMPPKGKLTDREIASLEKWIEMGAPWPIEKQSTSDSKTPANAFDWQQRRSEHWCWQPHGVAPVPNVVAEDWGFNEVDQFILSNLESNGIEPSERADRETLVRRLYFDLIGLPPTPKQVRVFVDDDSASAVERLVDGLLASPHFGERWGRHWLDLVRYAESRGHEFDEDSKNAYQYRDYVIRALNADVSYDQFVREHIAGDLLDSPRLNPVGQFNESILGTGFWFLGEWAHSPVDIRKDETDRFDNMIDVMSKTFLGVTVSCARCHDHKFDAIPTSDYYSLSGFLQSSDYRQVRFDSIEHNRDVADRLRLLDERFQKKITESIRLDGVLLEDCLTTLQEDFNSESPRVDSSVIAVDYREDLEGEFLQDGFLFGAQPQRAGSLRLMEQNGTTMLRMARSYAAVSSPFWNGLQSIGEEKTNIRTGLQAIPRSGRTLRTPTFVLNHGELACRVRGAGHVVACVDSHRLIAGPLHGKTIVKIAPNTQWTKLDLTRYVGHRIHLEFTPSVDAELEVSVVLQGASVEQMANVGSRETRIRTAIDVLSRAMKQSFIADRNHGEQVARLTDSWATERAGLQKEIQLESRLAIAMMDGTGEDDHTLIRGSSKNVGAVSPRHFLSAISSADAIESGTGSGRLQLARQINAPDNPLTSRVMVNRIWLHLFGRGIVATPDDFGVLGQRPTHPELLDFLANRFLQDGRSIKRMIRYLVLSKTYQLSSRPHPQSLKQDENNIGFHYRPPRRLEGEVIRDQLLAISGRLDRTQFGESVPIHLTPFMDGRGRPGNGGPLDGKGRRTIYVAVRRNFLSPMMLAFDTPAPFSTMGRRNQSNVPAQSLILMNDPLIAELSAQWAKQTLDQIPAVDAIADLTQRRIVLMYKTAFAREPLPGEILAAHAFIETQSDERGVDRNDLQIWADFAHVLVNKKEFVFLR